MKPRIHIPAITTTMLLGLTISARPNPTVTVQVDLAARGTPVAPTMFGVFFEDINSAADGGLYAELVQNRSFEHSRPLYAWSEAASPGARGRLTIAREHPIHANNPQFLRIHVSEPGRAGYGVSNSGYDGIVLRAGASYQFSVFTRVRSGSNAVLKIDLVDETGRELAGAIIQAAAPGWEQHRATLVPAQSTTNGRLRVMLTTPGVIDVDMVSLFPEETFNHRPNGLRPDLARAIADLKPGFLRFPGGCIVEGRDFNSMYRWKDTIGPLHERKQNWNLWENSNTPQYYQTYGLGFFEFFQFAEDIGAEPLPVLNCGMACQARGGPVVPLAELAPFIQDALDLIEFANGAPDTYWGARRAAMGHPEPFNLKYIAVGNEQWLQDYFDRYVLFYKAIKARHPHIQVISSSGPFVDDSLWRFAWEKFNSGVPADLVDEHYYVPPRWMFENFNRYEKYSRSGPAIFVGEYAAHETSRRNTHRAALAEAAYITGLLRHCDVVKMASYAPLLAKLGHDQWRPNLIWFDNTRVVLTPNYYVQAMYANNRPEIVLPTTVTAPSIKPPAKGKIGVGTWRTRAEFKEIKVVSTDGRTLFESDFSTGLSNWQTAGGEWTVVDGALRQTTLQENCRAITGDPDWDNYILTLKARKIDGEEGFLVIFETRDINAPVWWNLGGWRNVEHGLQGEGMPPDRVRGSIETNRWYEIKIESTCNGVRTWLDGQLVHQVVRREFPIFYAVAGTDTNKTRAIIFLVNPFDYTNRVEVVLNGARPGPVTATAITLSHPDPDADNWFDRPDTIKPRTDSIALALPRFTFPMAPYTFTVLKLPLPTR